MFVEIFDRVEQITVEDHLGDVNRSEELGDGPTVGQCPTVRGCHPIRVIGTQCVAVRHWWFDEVIEPDSTVHI